MTLNFYLALQIKEKKCLCEIPRFSCDSKMSWKTINAMISISINQNIFHENDIHYISNGFLCFEENCSIFIPYLIVAHTMVTIETKNQLS